MARPYLRPPSRWALAALAIAGAGLLLTRLAYAPHEFRLALQLLLAGWFVALMGAVAARALPERRTGPLLLLAGAAWFLVPVGDLVVLSERVEGALSIAWAAALLHATLTLTEGRMSHRSMGLLIAFGYAAVLAPAPLAALAIASGGLVGAAVALRRGGRVTTRWDRIAALAAALALAVALLFPLVGRHFLPGGWAALSRPATQLGLMACAGVLAAWSTIQVAGRRRITDLVLDLGRADAGYVEAELARALRDPTLRVGVWVPERQGYVTPAGGRFQPRARDMGRLLTSIDRPDGPVAVLEHDRSVATDPALRNAIARAVALTSGNAALLSDLAGQAAELHASRGRLVRAADDARLAIRGRLRKTLEPLLLQLEEGLRAAPVGPDPATDAIAEQVHDARREIAELADGLFASDLDHLDVQGAVASLAERCPVPVTAQVTIATPVDRGVQRHLLFIVGEALANVVKHAHASRADVRIRVEPGVVQVDIVDDGAGGADPARGSGLMGLRDRAASLGGTLSISSPPGGGTHLQAILPWRIGHEG